ncbi:TetR/AcrR family transcriptional regulator [Conexibacter sp. DBS9H8]|uniref:TetR/AcrR family transcriptional regulator n=1 Tax=Conexibacter sp. DBS9H8 TaxID=2937801 RepID=UPI00200E3422|nr:TetR/AcrR family transcriptional regulator [Conexibacter sp. DBS9H8]
MAANSTSRTPRLAPENRREQLLDATMAVLAEAGFSHITVEAIAQAAGVTRPVIYDTFGDLGSLLLALIERADRRVTGQLAAILGDGVPSDPSPDRFLIDTINAFLAAVREDPSSWRLVLMPPPGNSAELNFRLQRGRGELAGRIRALLDWGLPARGGPRGLDHELTARLLVAIGEDAARLMLAHPRRFSPDRLAAATIDLLAVIPPTPATARADTPPPRPEIAPPARMEELSARFCAPDPRRRVPQAERREQLLNVALVLVAEEGFGALTMEAIARRAEVNRVVIYRSFANLGVLITALMHREDQRVRATLAGLIPQDPGGYAADEVLFDSVHRLLSAACAYPLTWRLALLRPENAPRILQRIVNRRRAALAKRIEPLVGYVIYADAPDTPGHQVEAIARMLLTIGEEIGRLAITEPDAFTPARLLRSVWRLLATISTAPEPIPRQGGSPHHTPGSTSTPPPPAPTSPWTAPTPPSPS